MWCARKIAAVLTFGIALAPAYAADGIKASGIAVRTAPADTVSVGFQVAEPAPEPGQEKNDSGISILKKALEEKGIKVVEATESRLPSFNAPVNNPLNTYNNNINIIRAATPGAKITKHILLQLSDFRRPEEISGVLSENGVRYNIAYTFDSSKFDAIREDLQREAIAKAIAQARDWARDAGLKPGAVLDLSVSPVNSVTAGMPFAIAVMANQPSVRWNMDQNLIAPAKEGEPYLIRYTVVATVVLAAKPE